MSGSLDARFNVFESRDGDLCGTTPVVIRLIGDGLGLCPPIAEEDRLPVDPLVDVDHVTGFGKVLSLTDGSQRLGDRAGIGIVAQGRRGDVPLGATGCEWSEHEKSACLQASAGFHGEGGNWKAVILNKNNQIWKTFIKFKQSVFMIIQVKLMRFPRREPPKMLIASVLAPLLFFRVLAVGACPFLFARFPACLETAGKGERMVHLKLNSTGLMFHCRGG